MIQKFTLFFLMAFFSLPALAQEQSLSLAYFNADYHPSYKDQGENLLGQFQFANLPNQRFQLGGTYVERTYAGTTSFYKQSLILGDTWSSKDCACYLEARTEQSGSTPIGAQSLYGLTPHTTYFTHWDLGLGLTQAVYQTGNVFTLNPQILYLTEGRWIFGHGSWIFSNGGTHSAWREFVRYSEPKEFKIEASIAGGENREDVGLIDHFMAYGLNLSKYWNHRWGLGLMFEHYEGNIRKGDMYQVELQWLW